MARKTYPETPEEEAARINAASGDPDGITAEQVANNRQLNESLTGAFTTGGGLSINPFSRLVSSVSTEIQSAVDEARTSTLPSVTSSISKTNLDSKISRLSGDLGSGLNQASAGGLLNTATSAFGNISNTVQSTLSDGSLSNLATSLGSGFNLPALNAGGSGEIISSISDKLGGNLATGLKSIATGISAAAGNLNDILSLKRGAGLPKGGELFSTTGESIKLNPGTKDDWRVRVNTNWTIFNPTESEPFKLLQETGGVVFPYLPSVQLSTKANYIAQEPTHNNFPFQAYKNSAIDQIQISGEFSAETENDAAYWIAATLFFKTATKMFFGQGNNAGNPPIICQLNGYGASVFDNVPVVVTTFSVDFPQDVNYVRCNAFGTNTWVPIKSTISISLQPIYNRRNLRQFSLEDYARGGLTTPTGQGYL
jgi:hypothetical protein